MAFSRKVFEFITAATILDGGRPLKKSFSCGGSHV